MVYVEVEKFGSEAKLWCCGETGCGQLSMDKLKDLLIQPFNMAGTEVAHSGHYAVGRPPTGILLLRMQRFAGIKIVKVCRRFGPEDARKILKRWANMECDGFDLAIPQRKSEHM